MRLSTGLIALVVTCLCLAACNRREGLNFGCAWVQDAAFRADVRNQSHQRHLLEDIAVAEELAIRHGDHTAGWRLVDTFGIVTRHGGIRNRDAGRVAREECKTRLLSTIVALHEVTGADIDALRPRLEERGADLPVTIPLIIGFSFAMRGFLRWLRNRFDPDEWAGWAIATVLGSIAITAIVLAFGAAWAVAVEIVRVGNEHLASRGRTESLRNNFLILFVVGVFASWIGSAMAAVRRYRVTMPEGEVPRNA